MACVTAGVGITDEAGTRGIAAAAGADSVTGVSRVTSYAGVTGVAAVTPAAGEPSPKRVVAVTGVICG